MLRTKFSFMFEPASKTHLNNVRIQKQAVGHADVIQCGSLMIRFIDEGGVNVDINRAKALGNRGKNFAGQVNQFNQKLNAHGQAVNETYRERPLISRQM